MIGTIVVHTLLTMKMSCRASMQRTRRQPKDDAASYSLLHLNGPSHEGIALNIFAIAYPNDNMIAVAWLCSCRPKSVESEIPDQTRRIYLYSAIDNSKPSPAHLMYKTLLSLECEAGQLMKATDIHNELIVSVQDEPETTRAYSRSSVENAVLGMKATRVHAASKR